MKFVTPLIEARLIKRYKRFLADVRLADGEIITVHCPTPGAMLGLDDPNNRVWISNSNNPKRKLLYTLEMIEIRRPQGTVIVGINTMLANKIAEEAIAAGYIPELADYKTLRREVPYGTNSRIDLLLESKDRRPCYVEIKNVNYLRTPTLHEFPNCKTERGTKHLRELAAMAEQGARSMMLYVIQRNDGDKFSIAADIDPAYAKAFHSAQKQGVEALAIRCNVSQEEIIACDLIPIV
ncbi:MAG: DNA/RNA nuclease SfsA [Rhizobiaceae bacterium]